MFLQMLHVAKVMFLHVSVILFTGWGSPGPYPGGIGGLAGGLQVHTRGEVGGSGRGVSRPRPGGGGSMPRWGDVSQHALRQTSPKQAATAADGTDPTGMHSCLEMSLAISQISRWSDI